MHAILVFISVIKSIDSEFRVPTLDMVLPSIRLDNLGDWLDSSDEKDVGKAKDSSDERYILASNPHKKRLKQACSEIRDARIEIEKQNGMIHDIVSRFMDLDMTKQTGANPSLADDSLRKLQDETSAKGIQFANDFDRYLYWLGEWEEVHNILSRLKARKHRTCHFL